MRTKFHQKKNGKGSGKDKDVKTGCERAKNFFKILKFCHRILCNEKYDALPIHQDKIFKFEKGHNTDVQTNIVTGALHTR